MPATFATLPRTRAMERAGFRFGPRGTQASRTIMLGELTEILAVLPADATRDDYGTAIVEENALGKRTYATRLSSRQRLNEMYGLDPRLALFRVLRYLWKIDPAGRPLLAMLCALARDPSSPRDRATRCCRSSPARNSSGLASPPSFAPPWARA